MTFKTGWLTMTVAAGMFAAQAMAQDFPSRTVTIVVPYSAGGGTAKFARALDAPLEETIGTDIVIQNLRFPADAVAALLGCA